MLSLSILRCPEGAVPETRQLKGGEFRIGRGPDNDWVLPDPERVLSKRHCVIAYRSGSWQVADISTNGTYLNADPAPIGSGAPRALHDGDRLRFGAYEIEARIEEAPHIRQKERAAFADPFGDDPLAAPAPAPQAVPDSWFGGQDVALPGNFDPLAPEESPFGPSSAPDHSPAHMDAFHPPPAAPRLLPDDWDPNGSFAAKPPSEPPKPVQAVPPLAAEGDLLAAFLEAAGMSGRPDDPELFMRRLGTAFRALVSGLRQAMIARASVKGEFRIEQTMIRARGNNPLKFSADDDDALSALLGIGRRTDMEAGAAIADALRDIRLHELATMNAMQEAVRALLARLDPAKLRDQAEQARALLPAQRRARAFDAFEALHGEISRGLADDFDSVFGRAFARAYERALAEAEAREQ